jgi:ribosomal protein S8
MNISSISKFIDKLNMARQGHFISIKLHYNTISFKLLTMFENLGIIRGFHIIEDNRRFKVFLKYTEGGQGFILKLSMVSTPGKRVYVDLIKLAKLKEGASNVIFILSTPIGLLFDYECVANCVGGEVILKIELQ